MWVGSIGGICEQLAYRHAVKCGRKAMRSTRTAGGARIGGVDIRMSEDRITIKKGLKLGELNAEADESLLRSCFIDNGVYARVVDVEDAGTVVVGRTGSGKSALIYHASKTLERSVIIDPENVSIRYLEHSNIIEFLTELGVNLDIFYRYLWRHVIIVELLKLRYNIKSIQDRASFGRRLIDALRRDEARKRAVQYLEEWGERFWLETDEQLRELTQNLDRDIRAGLRAGFSNLDLSVQAARALSSSERVEVISRAKRVVSNIQMKKLHDVTESLVANVFNDEQKRYYLLVDHLDENWAETDTRCRFIRALIEEVKFFRNIPQVKVLVVIRDDLLELVYDRTRDPGFQQEKYEAYTVPLQWSIDDLRRLVGARVSEVFRRQYTKATVEFDDIFPRAKKGGGETALSYMVDRTLMRPRDLLQFANECFLMAYDRDRISWRAVRAAEANYSKKRLKSLFEEWGEIYPQLGTTIEILRRMPSTFTRSTASGKALDEVALALSGRDGCDPCVLAAKSYLEDSATKADVLSAVLQCLYRCGAIGIKISSLDTFIWSFRDQTMISASEAKRATAIKVHKMLFVALEVSPAIFDVDDVPADA